MDRASVCVVDINYDRLLGHTSAFVSVDLNYDHCLGHAKVQWAVSVLCSFTRGMPVRSPPYGR